MTMVPVGVIPVIWAEVLKLLAPAIEMSAGEVTEQSAYDKLMTGVSALVIVAQGSEIVMAFTVSVVDHESGKRELSIPLMGGKDLEELRDVFMPFIARLAKNMGCSTIVGYAARDGWARKLKSYGWSKVREIIKYEVSE